MKNFGIFACIIALSFVSVGCKSRTRLTLGPLSANVHAEFHESRGVSLNLDDGIGVTYGSMTVGVGGKIEDKCTKLIGIESITGATEAVDNSKIAKD